MPAFQIKNNKARRLNQREFKDEQELHKLIDENIEEIFNIRYIKKEHITDKHGRIETLGIDENNRPTVIEYKKVKEKGQLTQANRYMIWIKQNPDSFELLVKNNLGDNIGAIDFANPRVLCFAQEYSIDDKCLALSLDAELWKYRYYENGTLVITREEEPEQLVRAKGKSTIERIKKEGRTRGKARPARTLEDHLKGCSDNLVNLFNDLDKRIMGISAEIDRYTTYSEIIYKTSVVFAPTALQKNKDCIRIYLRTVKDKIKDPLKLTRKVPKKFGYGHLTRQVFVYPQKISDRTYSVDDIMDLILQSYNATQ